jgi:hypothetical protein
MLNLNKKENEMTGYEVLGTLEFPEYKGGFTAGVDINVGSGEERSVPKNLTDYIPVLDKMEDLLPNGYYLVSVTEDVVESESVSRKYTGIPREGAVVYVVVSMEKSIEIHIPSTGESRPVSKGELFKIDFRVCDIIFNGSARGYRQFMVIEKLEEE